MGSFKCLLCFRVRLRRLRLRLRRLRLRLRRRRGDPLSAHFLGDYLVDLDQTSHKYSLGQGGLQAKLIFDLDLLLRLKKIGPLVAVNHVVSSFRWHPDSLTVDDRTKNLKESERAKRNALPAALKPISPLWDAPVRWVIRRAANRVSSQAQAKS